MDVSRCVNERGVQMMDSNNFPVLEEEVADT